MDDPHLLHMAINMNFKLMTCEQLKINSIIKMIENYDFNLEYKIEGLLDASNLLLCIEKRTKLKFTLKLLLANEFNDFIDLYLKSMNNDINKIMNIILEKQIVFILFETSTDDLHNYLKNKIYLNENEIINLFKQILKIVNTLHHKGIILNDLKLRKFVFKDENRKLLKLENLDGASFSNNQQSINYGCVLYQAPEKLIETKLSDYDPKLSDCWSLGIILYTLLFGKYPFHHSNLDILKDQILNSELKLPQHNLKLESLVTSLLNKNVSLRLNTDEILKNELFLNEDLNSFDHSIKEYNSKLINLIDLIKLKISTIKHFNKIDYLDYNLRIPIINYYEFSDKKLSDFDENKIK